MKRQASQTASIAATWELARSGNLRGGADGARTALRASGAKTSPASYVELHLITAFCSMRQGDHPEASRALDAAHIAASLPTADAGLAHRVETWRAELAYMQGRYTEADAIISRVLPRLEEAGNRMYEAFALRIRIAILLARGAYEGIAALADHATAVAEASGDDYVMVQVLNILGAAHFDRATSKLREPHARSHMSLLDPRDTAPMEGDARDALRFFEAARKVAERAHYEYAAWYVAGNIERLDIILGNADRAVRAIRKRLTVLQKRGARYDEIVTRSNLAWGLRTLGRYRESLHELDVALALVRDIGTFNVLLEFLEYDRSIVLDALGDTVAARASYRSYLRQIGARNRHGKTSSDSMPSATSKRPLEPYFLKRADRYVLEHIGNPFTVLELAKHCGVSGRTLEKSFMNFRGLTPVAHVRNLRLDQAHDWLDQDKAIVGEVAARCGFRSSTTFTLEYRKRFGMAPSRRKRGKAE